MQSFETCRFILKIAYPALQILAQCCYIPYDAYAHMVLQRILKTYLYVLRKKLHKRTYFILGTVPVLS